LRIFTIQKNQKEIDKILSISQNRLYNYNNLNTKDFETLGFSFGFSMGCLLAKAIFVRIFKEKTV